MLKSISTVLLAAALASSAIAADQNWMGGIANATRLSAISIPGTHDSGARFESFGGTAKCQNATIPEQLDFGIRLLDIRCKHVNDAFAIYHGTENQHLTYTQVLDQVIGFLAANPTECVIMSVKEEGSSAGTSRSFEATFDSHVAANPGGWSLVTSVPALATVRGKIVLLRRFPATSAKGINATNWPDNTSFNVNNLNVQDNYQVSDNPAKWNAVATSLDAAFAATNSAVLHLNFTSGYKPGLFGIPNIPAVSNAINPQLTTRFTGAAAGHYGCILMDFADAARTELIYQTNFPPRPPVFSANPVSGIAASAGTAYAGTLAGTASDPNPGDAVTFSKVDGPAWLAVAANGALSGTPGAANGRINTFTIRATDNGGLFAQATVTIVVTVPRDPGP